MPRPGWQIDRHDTLDSTSDEARRLVAGGDPRPWLVVWADRQTRGRGRGSNTWWSDSGSLTLTLAFDPTSAGLATRQEPKLALAAGMACAAVVERLIGRSASIRWPNDLEVDGRKLAGFLVERIEGPHGPRLLIGAGVNVATRLEDAPAEVAAMATSLRALGVGRIDGSTGRRWRWYVLISLLREFETQLDVLMRHETAFDAAVNRRDSLAGRRVRILQAGKVIEGTGRGINPDGSLSLETSSGTLAIYGGQVLRGLP